MNIVLVYKRAESFAAFQAELEKNSNISLRGTSDPQQAVDLVKKGGVEVVVADEELTGQSGLEFLNALVKVNALVNTALVSQLAAEDFHEETEGLGVLMPLNNPPTAENAKELQEKLVKIAGLMVEAQEKTS